MHSLIKEYIIVGYTIEAVLVARKMADIGKKVTFIASGKLGDPCDDISDYLTHDSYSKILECGIEFTTDRLVNSQYVHVPYEKLKMVSDLNGLIDFPLSRNSFGTAKEWEDVSSLVDGMGEFNSVLDASNNYINLYKKFFPRWLYDSILRHMGVNKWDIKQSQFTKSDLIKLFSIESVKDKLPRVIYQPTYGYKELCDEILKHKNIKIDYSDIKSLRELLVTRTNNTLVVFVDNRVDSICRFSMGMFDRREFIATDVIPTTQYDEFVCLDKGIVHTPLKEYWGLVKNDKKVIALTSSIVTDSRESMLVPSQDNLKIFNEYTKLFSRYPNKQFIIPAPMTILR